MSGPLVLELLTRGIAVGAFLGLASLVLRGGASPARATGALFALAAAAHTLTQWPGPELRAVIGWPWTFVEAASVAGAALFWAFVTELFEDRARLDWRRFAPAVLLLGLGVGMLHTPFSQAFALTHKLASGALILHAFVVVAGGWRTDLVESRRRLRGPILVVALIYALGVILVEASELFMGSASALSPLAAGALMVLALLSLAAFGQADSSLFGAANPLSIAPPQTTSPSDAAIDASDPELARALTASDRDAVKQLEQLMRAERPYREEGLAIATLALRLKLPEHRLRRLINQGMGYRNFNDFLNQWRLAEVKAALSDPAQAQVPVATIALDAGFGSLGAFNRAFKAESGLTPSQYRVRALHQGGDPSI